MEEIQARLSGLQVDVDNGTRDRLAEAIGNRTMVEENTLEWTQFREDQKDSGRLRSIKDVKSFFANEEDSSDSSYDIIGRDELKNTRKGVIKPEKDEESSIESTPSN